MQKLSLKDFEHHISPNTWYAADDLVQAGSVKNLREIEKHFWVALVETDEGDYESEVIITPHKVKAYACECFTEGRRLMCPHIAATLIKVRQFLEQKEENRRSKAEQKAPPELSRFTVQAALENADPQALLEFVRDYARRDRDFSLALKTRFAAQVTESENPFALLLQSVLPKPGAQSKMGEADFRRMRKALDGLEEQLTIARNGHDFRSTFQIASAIFLKINPLLAKSEGNRRGVLLHFSQKSFEGLQEVFQNSPSPELRESVWEALFQNGLKHAFPQELERNILQFFGSSALEEDKFQRLAEAFDQTPYPAPPFLLELFLTALSFRNRPEAAVRVLEDYREKPEVIRAAFLQLYYLKQWESATQIGEFMLSAGLYSGGVVREIENVLLFIAEQRGDTTRLTALLRQRFFQTGNADIFEQLKKAAGKKWPAERKKLLQELKSRGDAAKTALILSAESALEELIEWIRDHGDMNLLQRYESKLLPINKAFVQEQYIVFLGRYLEEHFGAPAAQHVRMRLSELLHKGETEMTVQIIRALTARFPERQSLPAELAELFPKSRRKML